MSIPSNGNGIWTRIALALVVPVAAALIGYGVLKSDVQHVSDDVQTRAPREVVDAQYQALLREIQALRADISDLKRRP